MILLNIIFIVSLLLGLSTGFNYLRHPLANSGLIAYSGGKYWLVVFIILIVKALKG